MTVSVFLAIVVIATLVWLAVIEFLHWMPRRDNDHNDRIF